MPQGGRANEALLLLLARSWGVPRRDLSIVQGYAHHFKLSIAEADLNRRALEWSMTRGSRSGRVAWQFIEDLAGERGQKLPF